MESFRVFLIYRINELKQKLHKMSNGPMSSKNKYAIRSIEDLIALNKRLLDEVEEREKKEAAKRLRS